MTGVHPVKTVADDTVGENGWQVEWTDASGHKLKDNFDYAIIATGLYNKPLHPTWAEDLVSPKPTTQDGLWVVDAKDFTDASVAKGKRVVVIGAGKTAHDVAVAASEVASSTTIVARRGHWMTPQVVLKLIPLEFATYTRWSWALQPAYYASGGAKKAAHTIFSPVKAAAWGLFGFLFPFHTGTPSNLIPKHGLLDGIYDTIGIVDSKKLSKAFKSKKVTGKLAEVNSVNGKKLVLSDGTEIEADIVVLATGYKPTASELFAPELRPSAGYDAYGSQWLYRNVLPADLANIAFIGSNATFQHVLTTALQSRWLVDVLKGDIKLPSHDQVVADIKRQKDWVQQHPKFGKSIRRNNYVWAQHGKYHDALVKDIRGYTNAYPRWNIPGEYFGYIYNQLYAPLFPGNKALQRAAAAKEFHTHQ